jgi:hypothetical protein
MSTKFKKTELNSKIGTRSDLYALLSSTYLLPDISCHCLSKVLLLQYSMENCPYTKFERNKVPSRYVEVRLHSASELTDILNKILKDIGKNPSGFSSVDPPNLQWLYDVISYLDPKGKYIKLDRTERNSVNTTFELDTK